MKNDFHRTTIVAAPDPPPKGVPNPIHDREGASQAGYAGALVAGVRTYGWAAEVLVAALGEGWLDRGWVDFRLPRPLFAGEAVDIEVAAQGEQWRLRCQVGETGDDNRCVLEGVAGTGVASWFDGLDPPAIAPAADAPEIRPSYELDSVPLREPLTPLGVFVSERAAAEMVTEDLGLDPGSHRSGTLHPFFLAARVAPLTRRNFTYGPTIHVRSQIQHLRRPRSERQVVVGAQIVEAYERKQHWYQVLDAVVSDDEGALAVIRHHTIFRPRPAQR